MADYPSLVWSECPFEGLQKLNRICNWHDNCEVLRTLAVNHPFEISTLISNRLIVCTVLSNKHGQGYAKLDAIPTFATNVF